MGRKGSWSMILLCHLMGAAIYLQAVEPGGMAQIHPRWVEPSAGAEGDLTLSVIPTITVEQAVLRITIPSRLEIELVTEEFSSAIREIPSDPETVELQIDLGDIPRRRERSLTFRLQSPARGGVAAFTLEGKSDSGLPVSETVGVMVGVPGMKGNRKHGAVEFPAVPVTGDRP